MEKCQACGFDLVSFENHRNKRSEVVAETILMPV